MITMIIMIIIKNKNNNDNHNNHTNNHQLKIKKSCQIIKNTLKTRKKTLDIVQVIHFQKKIKRKLAYIICVTKNTFFDKVYL